MINVSNAFRKELYSGNRKYLEYIDITLKSGKVLNLTNKDVWGGRFTIEDAVSNENSFDIGATIINQFTGVINNIYDEFSDYDFTDAKVIPYVGLELPDGTIEKIQKGIFTVSEPKYNGSIITLTCYDNMAKFDRPYTESTLVYPATLNQIVRDACSKCDVTLQTYDFPHDDFVVQERPSDEAITFREVIGWAAQIACCFARCDRYGRLELKWFDTTAIDNGGLDGGYFDTDNPYSSGDDADGGSFNPWNTGYVYDSGEFSRLENAHHIYSNYSINIFTDDVVITGVKVLEKAPDSDSGNEIITYMTGREGYVISIEGNELIKNGAGQTVVGWIGQAIIGFRFRKADFQHTSDPTIEAGDVAVLTDRKQRSYNILISSTTFTIGGSQSTKSSAEDPLKNSATRFSEATKSYVEYRKEIKKEKTDREQAIEELTNKINNSSGLYTTEIVQPDGSRIFNMHNKPVLAESDIIWRMTAEAWGVSTDGGETYNAGMTVDGDTIVRILTATGVNADWINTGTISVKNALGKEVFYVDVDTGQVRIVADSFSLSNGATIDSIAQSKVDALDDDLDQTGVFNRLTNNGQTQGIYLKNGRIYINATYISSGVLTLGGNNNVNGSMRILDSAGNQIGSWDSSGVYIKSGKIYNETPDTGIAIHDGRMYVTYESEPLGYIGVISESSGSLTRSLEINLQDGDSFSISSKGIDDNNYHAKLVYHRTGYIAGSYYPDLVDVVSFGCDVDMGHNYLKNVRWPNGGYTGDLTVANNYNYTIHIENGIITGWS